MKEGQRTISGRRRELVVANLHFGLIKVLLGMEGFRSVSRVIISGLLRTQWREVRHALMLNGFQIEREWDHEMTWFTILALRKVGVSDHGNGVCGAVQNRMKERQWQKNA